MVTHSSILAWRIPWTEEPGRLQSMKSQRVRHNCVTKHTCVCIYLSQSMYETNLVNLSISIPGLLLT